jgi:hypothetical protein
MRTWIRPPPGVYLTAFESRFQTICRRRSGSPGTIASASSDASMMIPFAAAESRTVSIASRTIAASATGCARIFSRPFTMPEKSRMSSTMRACACPFRSMASMAWREVAVVDGVAVECRRPAEDGVQRRAQPVRDGRQKVVLHPARHFGVPARAPLAGQRLLEPRPCWRSEVLGVWRALANTTTPRRA